MTLREELEHIKGNDNIRVCFLAFGEWVSIWHPFPEDFLTLHENSGLLDLKVHDVNYEAIRGVCINLDGDVTCKDKEEK
jgi:hypothetical protein